MMSGYSFSYRIAKRYLWSKRTEAFITILTFLSLIGIAISVMVLNVVMAIMGGFEYELKDRLLGTNAHVVIRSLKTKIHKWQEIQDAVSGIDGVTSVSPFTYHQALIRGDASTSGVLLKGILPGTGTERELARFIKKKDLLSTFSQEFLPESNLPPLLIGDELMRTMNLLPGSYVSLLAPQVQSSPFGLVPRYRRFEVIGRYSSGLIEYESTLAYTSLKAAQRFFRMGDSVTGLEVRINEVDNAPQVAQKIMDRVESIEQGIYAQDWTQTNKALWEALRLEKSAYFLVLLLLVILASFSIVSTLVMIVLEKRRDIAVLRTLGARAADIRNIFRLQGAIVGAIGTGLGLLLSLLACTLLQRYGFPLPENIFPVDTLPIRLDPVLFLLVGAASFVICCLATLYPAARASALKPSEILRYE